MPFGPKVCAAIRIGFVSGTETFGRINSKPGGPKKDYRNKTVHTHGLLDQNVRFETLQKATGSTSETYSEQLGGEFPCRHWDWMLFLELILRAGFS